MIKILFVCHGNICRSPIAEFVFRDIIKKHNLESEVQTASCATSTEEIGNPVYPPARQILLAHGLDPSGKTARQLKKRDYEEYDYLIAMESYNIRNIMRIIGEDPEDKVHRLLDFTERPGDIDDPWYTRDFETAYREIETGCLALFGEISAKL